MKEKLKSKFFLLSIPLNVAVVSVIIYRGNLSGSDVNRDIFRSLVITAIIYVAYFVNLRSVGMFGTVVPDSDKKFPLISNFFNLLFLLSTFI